MSQPDAPRLVMPADEYAIVTGAWRQWLDSPLKAALEQAIADAVAAERERIAALADECAAHCLNGPHGWRGPFADLIRTGTEGSAGNGE